jgi:uncharacterized membrane protein YgdD (TMEM256/DUF423 family)
MTNSVAGRIAAALGALGVALGAFGAHGLKALLAQNATTDIWEKAVFYHFVHAIALLVVSRWKPLPSGPVYCFIIGTLIFSGSLYVMGLTNVRWLGAITPLGGVSFIAGWLWLAVGRWNDQERTRPAETSIPSVH